MTQVRKLLDRYELAEQLGAGAMGTVYRAVDLDTQQTVAIKILKPEFIREEEYITRFTREAEALRQLDHPNIIKIFHTSMQNDQYFLVMEYISGGSLRDLLTAQHRLSIERSLQIALDLADALTRTHRMKIIHRDLKPENILMASDGTPRLTDFGVAHVNSEQRVTQSGVMVGTLDYLAPEVLQGQKTDDRVDIWGFGVILYEMLAGQRPFIGDNMTNVIVNILTQNTPSIAYVRPEVSDSLNALVYQLLQKDPEQRPRSIRQVGAELEAIIQGTSKSSLTTAEIEAFNARTVFRPLHNLPDQTETMVGYEVELQELEKMLLNPQIRLVTLTDFEIKSKSQFMVAAAARHIDHFRNGVYFINVSDAINADTLLEALAKTLPGNFDVNSLLKPQMFDYLKDKNILFLIDPFEQQAETIALLDEMLEAAPEIKIVVNARERLSLLTEVVIDSTYVKLRQAEQLLLRGITEFERFRTPLPEHTYKLILDQVNQNIISIPKEAQELWQRSRLHSFRQRLIFRALMVIVFSPIIILPSVFFAAITSSELNLVYAAVISLILVMTCNGIGIFVLSIQDYLNYSRRKKLWTFPLSMGGIFAVLMLLLAPETELSQPLLGVLFGMIAGAFLGLGYNVSLPLIPYKSFWQQIIRSTVIGTSAGILLALVVFILQLLGLLALETEEVMIIWVELPAYLTVFSLTFGLGVMVADRMLTGNSQASNKL